MSKTLTTFAVLLAVGALTGCNDTTDATQPAGKWTESSSTAEARTRAISFYNDVLSGQPGVCSDFTTSGRDDFVADMSPATTCEEAASILANAVGAEHVEEFTANYTYSIEAKNASAVVVRADFGTYADLMTMEWVSGQWMVGPTERVESNHPVPEPTSTSGADDGHTH